MAAVAWPRTAGKGIWAWPPWDRKTLEEVRPVVSADPPVCLVVTPPGHGPVLALVLALVLTVAMLIHDCIFITVPRHNRWIDIRSQMEIQVFLRQTLELNFLWDVQSITQCVKCVFNVGHRSTTLVIHYGCFAMYVCWLIFYSFPPHFICFCFVCVDVSEIYRSFLICTVTLMTAQVSHWRASNAYGMSLLETWNMRLHVTGCRNIFHHCMKFSDSFQACV